MMWPWRVLGLLALGLGGLSACSLDPGAAASPARATTLIVARAADAVSLDPALASDSESIEVAEQLFDRLVHWRDDTGEPAPGLAERWDTDAAGTTWTFHLRPGVSFHDGTPCDAAAVVFSFERQRDPDHPHHRDEFRTWQRQFGGVIGAEVIDPLTVRVRIDRPYAPFEANLGMFAAAIVSPTAVARWGDDFAAHPVGTGPFRFERWEPGQRIVLTRNPDYWDKPAEIERLVFAVEPDPRQRLVALESGAVDVAAAIRPDELAYVRMHPGMVLHRAPGNNVSYLAFNTGREVLADLRVRQALSLAINQEPIVQLAYQGMARAARGPLPPSNWAAAPAEGRHEFDPAAARRLLAAAAADGQFDPGQVLTQYAPTTPRPYLPDPERVARVVQSNLGAVGVRVELHLAPFAQTRTALQAGAHDLALWGWIGDSTDPDNFLSVLLDSGNAVAPHASNLAFYRSPEVHDLLRAALAAPTRGQRQDLYAQIQAQVAADVPWLPLAHTEVAFATRRGLGGVTFSPGGHLRFLRMVPR
jgi:peptide/nickel transport system substrate-binding protein